MKQTIVSVCTWRCCLPSCTYARLRLCAPKIATRISASGSLCCRIAERTSASVMHEHYTYIELNERVRSAWPRSDAREHLMHTMLVHVLTQYTHARALKLSLQVNDVTSAIEIIVTWDQSSAHRPLHWILFGKSLLMGTGGHVTTGAATAGRGGALPSSNEVPLTTLATIHVVLHVLVCFLVCYEVCTVFFFPRRACTCSVEQASTGYAVPSCCAVMMQHACNATRVQCSTSQLSLSCTQATVYGALQPPCESYGVSTRACPT